MQPTTNSCGGALASEEAVISQVSTYSVTHPLSCMHCFGVHAIQTNLEACEIC